MTFTHELTATAGALVARGRGILAIDESSKTCNKRFEKLGIEPVVEQRRAYRELLLTAPGLGEWISGAILYDETLRQSTAGGVPFVEVMKRAGVIPGIKVDTGTVALPGTGGELVTEGLDGLAQRVAEYYGLGARFAKWRAVISIGTGAPSDRALHANAHALARYARICQEGGLVPIVEPEVLADGAHSIEQCREATHRTLRAVFAELDEQGVELGGMILKPNMVTAGLGAPEQPSIGAVAAATVELLSRTVPVAVAGIAFLSGGQDAQLSTRQLQAMNELPARTRPWPLTFSYGRALQQPALEHWRGNPAAAHGAQQLLLQRARCNGAAACGTYSPDIELEAALAAV